MDDHIFRHPSTPQGHLQGVADQVGDHPFAQRPANHLPRVQIDQHSQVEPAFTDRQVGDIAGPFLVRRRRREVLYQQVGRHQQRMPGVSGGLELAGCLGAQALPLEAGGDGLAVYRQSLVSQVEGQSGGA